MLIRNVTRLAVLLGSALLSTASHASITWPKAQLLPTFSPTAHTQDLISIPPAGDTPANAHADAVLFSSLKGLVNRTKPRIWTAEGSGKSKTEWISEMGLEYVEPSDPWTLITKYRGEIKGVVVYDESQPDTVNLATAIAGQRGLLIASSKNLTRLTSAPYSLTVLVDLRGKFKSTVGVYEYLYKHYWRHASHRVLIGLNPTAHYGALREYAVAIDSATLWLDPRKPAEKKLLDRFLSSMGPGTLFMGWWPEEGSGVSAASAHGIVTVASDWCTNLSNFSGTPRKVAVKPTPSTIPPIENKIYLAIIMSDGDNLQYQEHRLHEMWTAPDRGKVPMGWTMSPAMLDAMPGVLDYYYRTSTDNDCLISGPSGYGYTYPNFWTDQVALKHFIAKTDDYSHRAGFRIITIWNTIQGGIDPKVGEAYAANAPSLLGLTAENAGAGLKIYNGGGDRKLPSFSLTATYCGVMGQLTKEIRGGARGWDDKEPRFLIIQAEPWHGLMPKDFVTLVNGLDPKFVVVRPDTLFKMMRKVNGLPVDPLTSQ